MTRKIAHQLDELTTKYVEAYGHLARMNVHSLEQAVVVRRMVVAKIQTPPDETAFANQQTIYEAKGREIDQEAQAARALIIAIIDDPTTVSDDAKLGRIENRIETVTGDLRRYLDEEDKRMWPLLEAGNMMEVRASLGRADTLRDEFNRKIEEIRQEMMAQVRSDANVTMRDQQRAIIVSAIVTTLAAVLGLTFAFFVSTGITRPVRRLLDGTRAVEAGRLDGSIDVTTRDEIGQLTAAFNKMVEQLRHKEHLRETFGRYVDPRVVEGLIDPQSLTASNGERRVMTVLFCDMKGFTSLSEGMTPQGLVKVMNHYLSTMSGPIRSHRGIIDKYIGDAIMAYWGPPFTEHGEQARLACLAAVEMADRGTALRTELPELLGVRARAERLRSAHRHCDRRGAGRQHRLGIHDELHGDGRRGESGLAPGERQQDLWQPLAGFGGRDRRGRRCGGVARDRPAGGRGPDPSRNGVRDHRARGRIEREATRTAGALRRGPCGLSGAPLG